jgi:FkbM family methyltransferase
VTFDTTPYKRIVLDVGANDGSSTLSLAEESPLTLVIAFEPSPELAAGLRQRAMHLTNYRVIEAAVDVTEGVREFNVAPSGVGSLQTLTPARERFGWLSDVAVRARTEVKVVRLDRVLESLAITRIDYLHCDAQGSDLRVLRSLGSMLSVLEEGVIEVPARTRLYREGHSRREAMDFLLDAGFRPWRVVAADVGNHEQNIFFRRAAKTDARARRIYAALFKLLTVHARLRVLPTRLRVRLAIRSRLRKRGSPRGIPTKRD